MGDEEQLVEEHKRHKRLFNLIVYMQIVSIKLTIGAKRPSAGGTHHMEMLIVHKSFDKKMLQPEGTGPKSPSLQNLSQSVADQTTTNFIKSLL